MDRSEGVDAIVDLSNSALALAVSSLCREKNKVVVTNVHALGLETTQGLYLTESFYWDLNESTRAFMYRIRPKTPRHWPNMVHAGDYAATLRCLKAVADMGVPAAKADGRAVVARMKAMPTDDDCFGNGYIREDGRKSTRATCFR